ncbi:MAG: helix-turn-helix domain-containing protein [Rhodobacteraceae bacterium]|nr:helix-turn-helix domain-containing protein [Paracoccaceae bacterium]
MPDTDSADDNSYFSEDSSTFGDRVAAARRAAGLKQEELAERLGVKLKTLRAWEDDVSEPRANRLHIMAGILNVSIVWLLTGSGEGVNDPWAEDFVPPMEEDQLLAECRAIRREAKRLHDHLLKLEGRLVKSRGQ